MADVKPLATYKDLCIDVVDVERQARFWGALLGLDVVPGDEEQCHLTGPTPQHTIWISRVPEAVTVKQRVHLDVNGGAEQWALDLGATVDRRLERWTIMRDPEGGEFCLFTRAEVPSYRVYELLIDCAEPEPIARWWAGVLGGTPHPSQDDPDWWVDGIPGLPFDTLIFERVPEPKTVKNRIHWDLLVPDLAALIAAGATVIRPADEEIRWNVLADPDGNEFCAFKPVVA